MGSTKVKSSIPNSEGPITLLIISAKVLPKQIRLPPKKGAKLIGWRFLPSGVRKNGLLGSNLSGMNSYGYCHSLSSLCRLYIPMKKGVPLYRVYFPTFTSSVTVRVEENMTGGSMRRDSLKTFE